MLLHLKVWAQMSYPYSCKGIINSLKRRNPSVAFMSALPLMGLIELPYQGTTGAWRVGPWPLLLLPGEDNTVKLPLSCIWTLLSPHSALSLSTESGCILRLAYGSQKHMDE